ncbi:MAG: hypothetical protein ACP5SH_23220 [Syntrophobacteraceae bacterium]
MYYELWKFARQILPQKSIWKDGELWSAIAGGIAAYFWFRHNPSMVGKIRHHFGDLLTATSIIFGFTLSALLFYIQAAAAWSEGESVARVAVKIVDWHVWTILCLLFLISYILGLWSLGVRWSDTSTLTSGLYGSLVFLLLYCGFQILNHTLTIWWAFRSREQLSERRKGSNDAT